MTVTLADADLDVQSGRPACRLCGATLAHMFLDLGSQPLANALLETPGVEACYPLVTRVCEHCLLVQADEIVAPETIFADYPFFSGQSAPWKIHCARYAEQMTRTLGLDHRAQIIEIASNDGTLLAAFDGPNVLGVDPAANVTREAAVPTITAFFTEQLARTLPQADLLIANNVLGHVPNLNDFLAGLRTCLAPDGTLTIEFPHLLNLINECQFDTIYHEHFSYWSLRSMETALARHDLRVYDLEVLPIHGGSLRLHVCHRENRQRVLGTAALFQMRVTEHDAGLWHATSDAYATFATRTAETVGELRAFFATVDGTVVGAGAPAKGNTLLNAAGITAADMLFVTDVSEHKQGRFLPGSHIPIVAPDVLWEAQPDYVLVLAWNWADAIMESLAFVREWGARFVIPCPQLKVI